MFSMHIIMIRKYYVGLLKSSLITTLYYIVYITLSDKKKIILNVTI